jgi:hypothetical protein
MDTTTVRVICALLAAGFAGVIYLRRRRRPE